MRCRSDVEEGVINEEIVDGDDAADNEGTADDNIEVTYGNKVESDDDGDVNKTLATTVMSTMTRTTTSMGDSNIEVYDDDESVDDTIDDDVDDNNVDSDDNDDEVDDDSDDDEIDNDDEVNDADDNDVDDGVDDDDVETMMIPKTTMTLMKMTTTTR